MRATIHPNERYIDIDGEPLVMPMTVTFPDAPVLDGFAADPSRPIGVIVFDGAIGTIQRKSRAPGRTDVEHFIGAAPLAPYKAVYDAEKARLDAERRKRNQEEELRAAHAAELAAQAEKGDSK